jgi:hypothetical protein
VRVGQIVRMRVCPSVHLRIRPAGHARVHLIGACGAGGGAAADLRRRQRPPPHGDYPARWVRLRGTHRSDATSHIAILRSRSFPTRDSQIAASADPRDAHDLCRPEAAGQRVCRPFRAQETPPVTFHNPGLRLLIIGLHRTNPRILVRRPAGAAIHEDRKGPTPGITTARCPSAARMAHCEDQLPLASRYQACA